MSDTQIIHLRDKYRDVISAICAGRLVHIPAMSTAALAVLLNDIAANREELHQQELPKCQNSK